MSGNSWCTCTKKLPQGWNTKACPVHDRDDENEGKRRNDDALYDSTPLTDGEKMAIGWWHGINQGRGDSMG